MYTFVMIKNTRRRSLCKPLEIEFNNNFFLCKLLRAVTLAAIWVRQKLFLSYYFTKKRPSKIFKIENFNRQTHNKNALIFTQ